MFPFYFVHCSTFLFFHFTPYIFFFISFLLSVIHKIPASFLAFPTSVKSLTICQEAWRAHHCFLLFSHDQHPISQHGLPNLPLKHFPNPFTSIFFVLIPCSKTLSCFYFCSIIHSSQSTWNYHIYIYMEFINPCVNLPMASFETYDKIKIS